MSLPALMAPVSTSIRLPVLAGVPTSKANVLRPTNSTTARNLCAKDWKAHHPKGTTEEFKTYYDSLAADQKKTWQEKSITE